jgi:hypothetical protein
MCGTWCWLTNEADQRQAFMSEFFRAGSARNTTTAGQLYEVGHPDAPRADSIAQRLGVSWAQLLRIADGPPSDALRALGNAGCHKGRKGRALTWHTTAATDAAVFK